MTRMQDLQKSLQEQRRLLQKFSADRMGAAAKRHKFEKRIRELENIKRNIERKLDNNADDVRGWQNRMRDALFVGMQGVSQTSALGDQVQQGLEKSTSEDAYCSQMICELNSEINRCQHELENASGSVSRADSNVTTTKQNIEKLNQAIREEASKPKGGK